VLLNHELARAKSFPRGEGFRGGLGGAFGPVLIERIGGFSGRHHCLPINVELSAVAMSKCPRKTPAGSLVNTTFWLIEFPSSVPLSYKLTLTIRFIHNRRKTGADPRRAGSMRRSTTATEYWRSRMPSRRTVNGREET
jgi:hypothetical protein